ncbi:MAG TPA: glycosyltransferase family 4 protein [Candidatus Limnocylindrales bacterium]|nr:glycosyltransferase family 4 protein [Candidatus Limnocylindrales bacterium]
MPPTAYGGTERVVAALADGLVDRGHDVVLFASGDSKTRARLVPLVERALWHDDRYSADLPFRLSTVSHAYEQARDLELDLMHSHADLFAFPEARHAPMSTVSTLHGRLDLPELAPFFARFADHPLVAVSDAQRAPLPGASWIATVHHGLPDRFRPGTGAGGYLAFCGRMIPEKGIVDAIALARRAELPLRIATRTPRPHPGDSQRHLEWDYYREVVRPLIDASPGVEWVGDLREADKERFFADALALAFPIVWPEPFGLVMIEALACGTPILARPRGSVPEVVRPGENGLLGETLEELIEAARRIHEIDRAACRADFERRFTADRMAADYERLYALLLAPGRLGEEHPPEQVEAAAAG